MKRLIVACLLIAASASGRTLHRATLPYTSGNWFWDVDVFISYASASSFAGSLPTGSADAAPIVVPTKEPVPRYLVFHKIFADYFATYPKGVGMSVYPNAESAFSAYANRFVSNKGVVSAADGSWIVWNVP